MTHLFIIAQKLVQDGRRNSHISQVEDANYSDEQIDTRQSTPHPLLPEIEEQIASFLGSHDLAQLSVVDTSWNILAKPLLYRHVTAAYVLYHSTEKTADERSIRLLWNLAQNPRHAAFVRTLNAAAVNGYDVRSSSRVCMVCGKRKADSVHQLRYCEALYEPVPENILDPNRPREIQRVGEAQYRPPPFPSNENERKRMIYAIAGRRSETCDRADHANRLVYWASFYLALEACVNATAVLFPSAPSNTPLDEACLELIEEKYATSGSHVAFLQLPYGLVDARKRNVQPYSPPLPLLKFITKAVKTLRVLILDQEANVVEAGVLAFMADHGVSVILSAVEYAFSRSTVFPVLYGVPQKALRKSLAQYFEDVKAYIEWTDLTHRNPVIQILYHPSQQQRVFSAISPFGPVIDTRRSINFAVASQLFAQQAGWTNLAPAQ